MKSTMKITKKEIDAFSLVGDMYNNIPAVDLAMSRITKGKHDNLTISVTEETIWLFADYSQKQSLIKGFKGCIHGYDELYYKGVRLVKDKAQDLR